MKNICNFLLGFTVLFLGFGLLAAEVSPGAFPPPRRNGGAIYSHRLTPNKHFFVPEAGNKAAMEPYSAMRSFKTVTRDAERMFSDECFEAPLMLLPAWAGIYAAKCDLREPGFGKNSMLYMLSQMYLGRFDKALASGNKLLESRPGDYGVLALMGLMSAYRRENFRYLETAFEMHPEHTLYLVHRCACQIPLFFQIKEDWDFVAAFFQMLNDKRERWDPGKLPLWTRIFMRDAFAEKYGKHWDVQERKNIPPHLLKVGVRFGGPELDTRLPAGGGERIRISGGGDHVIVRRLGPGGPEAAAKIRKGSDR